MRDPYKIIVWGPGAVGTACLKLLHGRAEFEVVGVLAHSASKEGLDVGTFIGESPSGLKISTDKESVLALDADCVLYCGQPPIDPDGMNADTIALLESGKNVISATAYFYPPYHGEDYARRIEDACIAGGSSLHGTGEQPGFFFERIAVALTGMCTELESVTMEEYVNVSGTSLETMKVFGVGQPLSVAEAPNPFLDNLLMTVFAEELTQVGLALFGKPVEISMQTNYSVADEDLVLKTGTIAKGNVSNLEYIYSATIDGKERLRTVIRWVFSGDDRWIIEVEGKPVSIRADISAYASLVDRSHFRPGDETFLTSYITAMPIIQAISVVCEAAPGFVSPSVFTHHTPDFRDLGTRKSIVG
ncbi:hypothetical protein O4220_13180 [Rhodococcus ruber]|uniref:Dihydrodipicolinate reductase N-terminal domain-containing protein n=1 Tax=Rhodococcus ruber TaxID=1830 RepID=A0ABT4MHE8_9NOCA|nr:hypothetical protein [Rhodococcus ruber]MCZ4519470.1 hypothetical protein [Rhodococcus ruber]